MKSVNLGLKVMKRLFAVFLVLGALMSVEAWGADNKQSQAPVEQLTKDQSFMADAYNYLLRFTKSMCEDMIAGAYKSISSIFNNIVSILLGLIAFFWLFSHLKNGTISREEVYKALIWIIVFIIVYVLLNSRAAFEGFQGIFLLPQSIVKAALTASFGMGGNVGEILNYSFVKPFMMIFDIVPQVFKAMLNEVIANPFKLLLAGIIAICVSSGIGAFYGIYILFNFIVCISIIMINLFSYFLSAIYIIFLPILIPLLLISKTRSIFFAWVKSYIAITMYIPMSMIPLGIINKMSKVIVENSGTIFIHKLAFLTILGIISCIIALVVLKKIPNWISELLGVQEQGVGMGGALGMLKLAGMGLGSVGMAALPAMAKSMVGSIANLKSGSGVLSTLGSVANIGQLGGYGLAKQGVGLAKNGFKSIANHFSKKPSSQAKASD